MDDLTRINGIGAATAEKLAAAGIKTFAKLAMETPEGLEKIKLPRGAEPDKWIAEAKTLAHEPEPKQMEQHTEGAAASTAAKQPSAGKSGEGNAASAPVISSADERAEQLIDEAVAALGAIAAARFTLSTAQSDEDRAAAQPHLDAALAELEAIRGRFRTHVQDVFAATISAVNDEVSTHTPRGEPEQGGEDNPVLPAAGDVRVKVTGPKQGRWRAGRQWTAEPVAAVVSATELEALKADPRLAVEILAT